jgi:hypothetical protein
MIAEFPAVVWLVMFTLLIPGLTFLTMLFNYAVAYFMTRDAAYQGAKCSTFTAAQTAANNAIAKDAPAQGVQVTSQKTMVFAEGLNGNANQETTGPLSSSSLNTINYVYYLEEIVTANINPLFPGYLGQYPVTLKYKVFFENPQGLTN